MFANPFFGWKVLRSDCSISYYVKLSKGNLLFRDLTSLKSKIDVRQLLSWHELPVCVVATWRNVASFQSRMLNLVWILRISLKLFQIIAFFSCS